MAEEYALLKRIADESSPDAERKNAHWNIEHCRDALNGFLDLGKEGLGDYRERVVRLLRAGKWGEKEANEVKALIEAGRQRAKEIADEAKRPRQVRPRRKKSVDQ